MGKDAISRLTDEIVNLTRRADEMREQGATEAQDWARLYVAVRDLDDRLNAARKPLTQLREHLSYTVIPNAFEDARLTTIVLAEGLRVTISSLVRAAWRDKDKALAWLRRHGHGDLIQETVNASTLSAFAKEEFQSGRELPTDVFNVHFGFSTSVTTVKK